MSYASTIATTARVRQRRLFSIVAICAHCWLCASGDWGWPQSYVLGAATRRGSADSRIAGVVGYLTCGVTDCRPATGERFGSCPLWVISRHHAVLRPCPLYPPKADIDQRAGHVR